jgi:5-dehydro-2-deoxygluconokinase
VFDVDYRPYSWASAGEAAEVCGRAAALADIVVGNDVEFGVLAGGTDGEAQARALADGGATIVVYKRGEAGAITHAGGRETRTGIYLVEALKPTGAGDAFLGGLLAALAAGRGVEEAVLRGSAAAAIVVGRVGCAPAMPTTAEVDAFLATHPGPTPT